MTNVTEAVPIKKLDDPQRGLFRVCMTSGRSDTSPPCEGAVRYRTRIIHRGLVDDPSKLPSTTGADVVDWFARGENHRVENGHICRDFGWEAGWFAEIPDVMEFVRQHGECIVSIDDDGYECIEIYDYYRE